MNKILITLLFCSISLSATEKTRLDLEWRAEPKNEKSNFALKWREEEKAEKPDTALKWEKETVNEMADAPSYALRHNRYTRPNSSDTMRGGIMPKTKTPSDFYSEFHSDSEPQSESLSIKW